MNDFQKSLDRYLTSEPEDHYTSWYEQMSEFISAEFYHRYEDQIETYGSSMDKVIYSFFVDGLSPQEAAEKT